MKIIVAPGSFRGSLTVRQAAEEIAASFRIALPDALIQTFPLADGRKGRSDSQTLRGKLPCAVAHGLQAPPEKLISIKP